ncbi:uncharacterized protein LOC130644945 isoform X3 [Hydractinia symbiolongicarpus]|uniref:uncharacterized protein LOC130644945 isoform X3 n=1 Tax=Hydractinia symbiolongicarpus TaxID=13093 RepID=UPI002549F168|nr:uncharacterized protein LOC130644945 isoform X3 [Hydractinia symbiolongicarpus]
MDFKAAISNSGEERLFKQLSSEIERRLPAEAVEWKRSYGRPPKQVVLQANFSKFDVSHLSSSVNNASSLGGKHLLHVFWTACLDNDTYKSWVKNSIARWQQQLQESSITDWLIIHVMYQENHKSAKSKIQLPRTSVFDKIKTDFGQKIQERCIQLWEPDKESLFTKSEESWIALLGQMRLLLLDSFGRQLDQFEDKIRVLREKYANPDWPFLEYFIVHEELAFIYHSIMLKEDALVQYDEVDALLSQFIINCSGKELPHWLEKFCVAPKYWNGVVLNKETAEHHRNLIKSGKASLLDFRNYLFARQCRLLMKNQKWEIPSRLLQFLFTVVHELKLLKIDLFEGVTACWIILTCMQFFKSLESFESKDLTYNATMAQLCDYMRQKLLLLGCLTGLYFYRAQTPEETNISERLCSGFGNSSFASAHSNQLRDALCSKKEFEKFYLDVTKKSMNMFDNIKRFNFSMVIGIDLAKFHLQHGRYIDAEPLLENAWNKFKKRKWETLYTDVLIPLADCQFKHSLHDRYLTAVALLSCAYCLPTSTRHYYSKELFKLSRSENVQLPVIVTEPVLKVVNIKIDLVKNKGHIGDEVKVILSLSNELIDELLCEEISIFTRHHDLSDPSSFTDNISSPRVSIFDQTDGNMDVSLTPEKQPIKENAKEPLTPSGLLKRIKSHRRTWSKNKNVFDGSEIKEEAKVSSTMANLDDTPITNMQDSLETPTNVISPTSKKASFTLDGDCEIKSKSTGDIQSLEESEAKLPLLALLNSNGESKKAESENYIQKLESKPLATSSVSEEHINIEMLSIANDDKSSQDSISSAEESSMFVQQEPVYDEMLTSGRKITLTPGINEVTVSAKIKNEGKYNLQSLRCVVGNLTLSKSFPSRNSKAFFMVADPPKITWTTDYVVDYLLTGSKQRLHVTLLNGPGIIMDGSILRITSNSGLLFYPLDSSSINIYPMERNGAPREAAILIRTETPDCSTAADLILPACKAFERVGIFFDVVAPVHRNTGESSQSQHEINFWYVWLKELVNTSPRLDCIFYEPFQVSNETICRGNRKFIKVTLCGVNPVYLVFSSPQLYAANARKNVFSKLSSDDELRVFGNEQCHVLWELTDLDSVEEEELECLFKVNFNTKHDDEKNLGCFEQKFIIYLHPCRYVVEAQISKGKILRSKPCTVSVTTKRLLPATSSYRLFLTLHPSDTNWRTVGDEIRQEVLFDDSNQSVNEFELVTDNFILASLPTFTLLKLHETGADDQNRVELLSQFSKGEVAHQSYAEVIETYDDNTVTEV